MRTQAQLLIGGYRQLAETFDAELSVETLRHLKLPWRQENRYAWDFWRDIQAKLHVVGEVELERALSSAFRRNRLKRAIMRILKNR